MAVDARLTAAKVLAAVREGGSLDRELPRVTSELPEETRATVQALVYGVLRYFERIEWLLRQLVHKPMKRRDQIVEDLLRVALFELQDGVSPDYAIVNSAVKLARKQRSWSAGLVNGCLRRYLREQEPLLEKSQHETTVKWLLPEWLISRLQLSWPDQWQSFLPAFSELAPMVLRADLSKCTREEYLNKYQGLGLDLSAHSSVKSAMVLVEPVSISTLPGFSEGDITVQDAAAQLAAPLLNPQRNERVLDACAAPGGKTTHLWEYASGQIQIMALEISKHRLPRLEENLHRADCLCEVKQIDAADLNSWWDGVPFDRILLDAPCTATGVIRRHPDIKLHRRLSDIQQIVAKQRELLHRLWETLIPGGSMLYATCSVLIEENSDQVAAFLKDTKDAIEVRIESDWGNDCAFGKQIFPGEKGMDGFYYAVLRKE